MLRFMDIKILMEMKVPENYFLLFFLQLLFISIVGIPVALVLAKSLSTYFNPIGKVCIDSELADELNKRKAKEQADKILN